MDGASLQGRRALVTGGGRGIGRAIAAALVGAGATVTVLGRDAGALDRAVAVGAAHHAAAADVTDAAALAGAVRSAGSDDLLVANAGTASSAPFARSDEALFRQMLAVNLMGVVHAAHAVMPGMAERGFGRIVAVASTAGLKGYPYVTAYCAAKHAVVGFVRALAGAHGRDGERRLPRFLRHGHGRPIPRQDRRQDRPLAGRGARRTGEAQPARAPRRAKRSRGRGGVAVRRAGPLRDGPGHRGGGRGGLRWSTSFPSTRKPRRTRRRTTTARSCGCGCAFSPALP